MCVFAQVVLINAKIFCWAKKGEKYFGIYDNYFSKNTKNKEIKLQICKFTETVICRWLGQKSEYYWLYVVYRENGNTFGKATFLSEQ